MILRAAVPRRSSFFFLRKSGQKCLGADRFRLMAFQKESSFVWKSQLDVNPPINPTPIKALMIYSGIISAVGPSKQPQLPPSLYSSLDHWQRSLRVGLASYRHKDQKIYALNCFCLDTYTCQ